MNKELPPSPSSFCLCIMTSDERLAIFKRDLEGLMRAEEAFILFNLAQDEDAFVQITRERAGRPLLCEVSNRSEGWNTHSMDSEQVRTLRAFGYEIPSPHHQSNPHKQYSGDIAALAEEVEKIFREVFDAPENYEVASSGVERE